MNDDDKAPYDQRAEADKQRYEQQMSMYVPTPGYSTKGSRKKVRSTTPAVILTIICIVCAHVCHMLFFPSLTIGRMSPKVLYVGYFRTGFDSGRDVSGHFKILKDSK